MHHHRDHHAFRSNYLLKRLFLVLPSRDYYLLGDYRLIVVLEPCTLDPATSVSTCRGKNNTIREIIQVLLISRTHLERKTYDTQLHLSLTRSVLLDIFIHYWDFDVVLRGQY